jgi:arginyl-tRNA synthetase
MDDAQRTAHTAWPPAGPKGSTRSESRAAADDKITRVVSAPSPSNLREFLTDLVGAAFAGAGMDASLGEVVVSQRPDLSQFQCSGAMAAAKAYRKNPRDIANDVIGRLRGHDALAEVSLAPPGFINLTVKDGFLASVAEGLARDARMGAQPVAKPARVMIDFGGPNVAKAMHVGHLRSSIIGDSLQRLFRFVGHDVVSDIHLGDWGTPMGMLIAEWRRRRDSEGAGAPLTIQDLEEMYRAAAARAEESDVFRAAAQRATVELQQRQPEAHALWKQLVGISVAALREDFATLGVSFDLWQGESEYEERIPRLVERLKASSHAVPSEGALVIPVAEPGDEHEVPPLMLVKSDGGYTYATTDLATLDERVNDRHADAVVYVVDKRQSLHFVQVFRAARATGIADGARFEHVAFGTMNGPDGKPFKTRAGGAMKLKDLMEMMTGAAAARMTESGIATELPDADRKSLARQIGLGALKYGDLMNHPASDYVFDLDRFVRFEGRTGPYLQYAAVRIKSIFRRAGVSSDSVATLLPPDSKVERDLMLGLAGLDDAVRRAYERCAPSVLAEFAYNLAQLWSRFYHECHILSESDAARRASWLTLAALTLRELELVLSLLGIETPEQM